MSDDHNVFNGEREPTNEELRAQWCTFIFVCPLAMLFLALEAFALEQGWAAAVLPHLVVVWVCLALLTFWRHIGSALLCFCICAVVAAKAFVRTWREEWILS